MDLTSLERELRGEDDGREVPPAYADLAEEYGSQDNSDSDQMDARRSG